jgi:hypothetical protein
MDWRGASAEKRGVGWSRCYLDAKKEEIQIVISSLRMLADPQPRPLLIVLIPDRTYSVDGKLVSLSIVRGGGLTVCDGPSFWLAHGI